MLAGGVIAAGCIAALVAMDRSPRPRPHIGTVAAAHTESEREGALPSGAIGHKRHEAPDAKLASQSSSSTTHKKKKADDMTMFVMVPDLPRENSAAANAPTGVWSDQGSAGPVNGPNGPQTGGLVSMASIGGQSLPLTSPTGQPAGGLPTAPGGGSIPVVPNPGGAPPPIGQPNLSSHAGFVMLAGGQGKGKFALASVQLYDPGNAIFVASSPMKQARTDHTATALPGGKILVVGGNDARGRSLSSAEVYDPASSTFSPTASKMTIARAEHSATLISGCNCPADGQVLISGGTLFSQGPTIRNAELYDPATGKFTATGAMKATRAMHTATLLTSGPLAGNVLIVGGISDESAGNTASAELYDPATGQFTSTGTMSMPREGHSATWLDPGVVTGALGGKVLIAGGGETRAPSNTAEVYNPQTGTFTPAGTMSTPRMLQAAMLLSNGQVLVAGGQSGETEFLTSAELFNPATASFSPTGKMINLQIGASATTLDNGLVLIAGGRSNPADLYDPAAGTFSATGNMVTEVADSSAALIR
ncbi:MAG TPA: kelch repeat-containing protein [Sporolactobacillaceae bacterium]|nr:kelch repeat-containing protein [Sporolactobacillaceae bacterium]